MYKLEVFGEYGKALVYTDILDQASRQQIQQMMDCKLFEGASVRIMPDVHAGKGSVIGFTSTLAEKLCPNVIGVDIGCGVTLDKLEKVNAVDFAALDKAVRGAVPSGFTVRKGVYPILRNGNSHLGHKFMEIAEALHKTSAKVGIDPDRVVSSIGTLGGGNHFIELINYGTGGFGLHLHSGSRGFGAKVAEFHQKKAYDLFDKGHFPHGTPKGLSWLEGQDAEEYTRDLGLAQAYASLNREVMAHAISQAMGWSFSEHTESIHNYIDFDSRVMRKGAISAKADEIVVVPISMADGVIIGRGLGNSEWNYSAPHGAGRLFARGVAKQQLSMTDFKSRMEGVWSSCVGTSTLDESPMAYKGKEYILDRISESVEVIQVAKPVYNFKATGE